MERFDEQATDVGERRQGDRRGSQGEVKVSLETRELTGQAENVSPSGVLFLSQGDLRVVIEFQEQGVTEQRTGRLVRAQRMKGDTIGWAVEFDARRER